MSFDFHTHTSCRNSLVSAVEQPESCDYWSLEFHPWRQPEQFVPFDEDFLSKAKAADALGEIGLDRLRGPALDVQRKFFTELLKIAEELSKPVVIHNVRCDSELDCALKDFSGRVLIHGFRGGRRKLLHHLELGRFVSFAPGAWKEHCALLRSRGLSCIGLETDDNQMYISDVYLAAERDTGISGWQKACSENFLRFIG